MSAFYKTIKKLAPQNSGKLLHGHVLGIQLKNIFFLRSFFGFPLFTGTLLDLGLPGGFFTRVRGGRSAPGALGFQNLANVNCLPEEIDPVNAFPPQKLSFCWLSKTNRKEKNERKYPSGVSVETIALDDASSYSSCTFVSLMSIVGCSWLPLPPCLPSFVSLHSLSFACQCGFLCPLPPASPFIAFYLSPSFFRNAIWGPCR